MRHVDELKLRELQARLAEIDENEFYCYRLSSSTISSSLKKCIEEYPIELMFLICRSIGFKESVTENRFNIITQNKNGSYNFRFYEWRNLSQIIVDHIFSDKDENEYVSLSDYIKKWIDLNEDYILDAKTKSEKNKYKPDNFREFLGCFFERIEEEVKKFLFHFCWSIYRGLPLYEKIATGKFSIVDDSNHDFVYLFMNGFYNTCPINKRFYGRKLVSSIATRYESFCIPEWTNKYYVNNKQLVIFNEFYREDYVFDDEQTVQLRRTAYRNAIGEKDIAFDAQNVNRLMTDENIFRGCNETKLMSIQKEVLKKFYGDLFDINEPDSWTKQTVVVDWLRQEFSLSDREAKAIDMITRPDIARGK